jgi:cellulose biosynthesis protein BcsQ
LSPTDASANNQDIKTKLTRLASHDPAINNITINPMQIYHKPGSHGRIIDLIPGYMELNHMARMMAMELNSPDPLNNCLLLKLLIQRYVDANRYDLVILDLGPDLYAVNTCALLSSDYVLIPCTADLYSTMSFRLLRNELLPGPGPVPPNHLYMRFGSNLRILGFVANRVKFYSGQPTSAQTTAIARLSASFADNLIDLFHEKFYNNIPGNTHPCYIKLIGKSLTEAEADRSLIDLEDGGNHPTVNELISDLIAWLNAVMRDD